MNWILLILAVVVVAGFILIRRSSLVSAGAAREHLGHGALVIDVRSPDEFNSGHLPGAINLPLDEIGSRLPPRVPDKNQELMLHCLSGMRSGVARRQLRAMGYTRVFNLGSYHRARKIVSGK